MKVDGVQAADAGVKHASPPAFQIIVLVSASGTGSCELQLRRSLYTPLTQFSLLYGCRDTALTIKFDRCLGRLVQSSCSTVCLHCVLQYLTQP